MQVMRCLSLSAALVTATCGVSSLHAEENVDLKVTRVALFSSGVGFFHREATVTDSAVAQLQFRAAQINDILKSLVVQDLDGGTVGVVSYASSDPIARTLASFGVNLTEQPTLGQILVQLRGESVEIAGAQKVKGTIVGVENHEEAAGQTKIQVDYLNLLTESGLQLVKVAEITAIKLKNEKVTAELNKALAALAAGHDADKKSVVVHFDGKGSRRVSASFLLESPIWKTSYRLVLAADKKPFLQGWAIVENATQEDWRDVRLSLISGRPISFTMDLYSPLYVSRPVEEMELYASLRPPTYQGGGFGGGGMGGGEDLGRAMRRPAGKMAKPKVPAEAAAPALALADKDGDGAADVYFNVHSGVQATATAQQAGELFAYTIQTPVSIGRQNSAMLPIINQEIGGEKLSIYNAAVDATHPLNGLMLENSTDLHLMQGPITVFDGSVYAGDAKLPDLRAGEKRLIAYALDLGTEVLVENKSQNNALVRVRIVKGVFYHTRRYPDDRLYQIKNKDEKDRTVLIEQPYTPDWKLVEPKEPFERTQSLLRFKVKAPAGKTVTQMVRLERVAEESVALTNLDYNTIELYLRQQVVSAAVKEALQKVVALRNELDQANRAQAARETQVKEATDEQVRVRENLKTLDRSTDAYKRQLKKFDALETSIESAREQLESARKEAQTRQAALDNYLMSLTIE